MPRLADVVDAVDVCAGAGAGAEHLGASISARRRPDGDERWTATSLPADHVGELLAGCPIDVDDESVRATLHPDGELGVTVVRITATHPSLGCRLDEVVLWAVSAFAVAELLDGLGREHRSHT